MILRVTHTTYRKNYIEPHSCLKKNRITVSQKTLKIVSKKIQFIKQTNNKLKRQVTNFFIASDIFACTKIPFSELLDIRYFF